MKSSRRQRDGHVKRQPEPSSTNSAGHGRDGAAESVSASGKVALLLLVLTSVILIAFPLGQPPNSSASLQSPSYDRSKPRYSISAAPNIADQLVIGIKPPSVTVEVGAIFTFETWVDAGNLEVAAIDAAIDFDPRFLEVVSSIGNPVTHTALISSTAMPQVLGGRNSANNTAGTIDYSAGISLTSPPVTGSFLLFSGYLRAREPTSGTLISLHSITGTQGDIRNVVVADPQGNLLAGALEGATIVMSEMAASPTATATSTPTATASSTATPTASATPTSTPWLVFLPEVTKSHSGGW